MFKIDNRFRPYIGSLLLFIGVICIFNFQLYKHGTKVKAELGQYVYPLDDTYFHLAIARNVTQHTTWGMTRHAYSNTSSSPVYTSLLAGLMIFTGNKSMLPLYLNVFLANLLIIIVAWHYRKKPVALGLFLIFLLGGSILKVQVFTGMEPVLQMLVLTILTLSFLYWAQHNFASGKSQTLFFLILSFVCLTRYELIAPALTLVIFLFLKKRTRQGLFGLFMLLSPPVVWGLYSLSKGEFFLPNALIAKVRLVTQPMPWWAYFLDAIKKLTQTPHYLYPTLLMFFLLIAKLKERESQTVQFDILILSVAALFTLLAHLMLGGRGMLFRYEAYLIAFIGLACAETIPAFSILKNRPFLLFATVVAFLFSILSFYKNYFYHNFILYHAHRNIHDQQWQTSAFVKQYYSSCRIMANDIGALCYENDIQLFDLVGLGTASMLRAWLNGFEAAEKMTNSQNFDLMLVYDSWFKEIHINNRRKVAELIISNNMICGDSVVAFYIPAQKFHKTNSDEVINALEAFQKTLPQGVKLLIYKTTGQPQDVHVHQSN